MDYPNVEQKHLTENGTGGFRAKMMLKNDRVEFSHVNQLGPPKTHPLDVLPEFDFNDGIVYRPSQRELHQLLSVTSGKSSEVSFPSSCGNVKLERIENGFKLHIECSSQLNSRITKKCSIDFCNEYAIALQKVLDSVLVKSFGFHTKHDDDSEMPVSETPKIAENTLKNRRKREKWRQERALERELRRPPKVLINTSMFDDV